MAFVLCPFPNRRRRLVNTALAVHARREHQDDSAEILHRERILAAA